eukprot:6206628-Pleurochrysis_carterae.AAC.1
MVFNIRCNQHHVKHSCRSDPSDRVATDIPYFRPVGLTLTPIWAIKPYSRRRCRLCENDIPVHSISHANAFVLQTAGLAPASSGTVPGQAFEPKSCETSVPLRLLWALTCAVLGAEPQNAMEEQQASINEGAHHESVQVVRSGSSLSTP